MTTWSINVSIEPNGDLVWAGSDSGPHLSARFGASDYEWWRRLPAAHLPAFAEAHGIETTFSSWTTTDWS